MSDDLIRRSDAIKAMAKAIGRILYDAEAVSQHVMNSVPAVEPKQGEWIDGRCDQCGGHAPFWSMASTYYKSNYCPSCGARMKGTDDA